MAIKDRHADDDGFRNRQSVTSSRTTLRGFQKFLYERARPPGTINNQRRFALPVPKRLSGLKRLSRRVTRLPRRAVCLCCKHFPKQAAQSVFSNLRSRLQSVRKGSLSATLLLSILPCELLVRRTMERPTTNDENAVPPPVFVNTPKLPPVPSFKGGRIATPARTKHISHCRRAPVSIRDASTSVIITAILVSELHFLVNSSNFDVRPGGCNN